MSDTPCIFWFREDLRLRDNPALQTAVSSGQPIICVFIFDEESPGDWSVGGARKWWLHHSLDVLSKDLAAMGGQLVIQRGQADEVLPDLVKTSGADHVYWTRRYAPYQIETDKGIKEGLEQSGVNVTSINGRLLFEPWRFKTGGGTAYRVFTPFWRSLKSEGEVRSPAPTIERLETAKSDVTSLALADLDLLPVSPDWASGFGEVWTPGEAGAKVRLDRFIQDAVANYSDDRNRPDVNGTSGLSPHLQHGEISPVQIWHAVQTAIDSGEIPEKQAQKFLSEIAWREFSYVLLFANPDMLDTEIQKKFEAFPWVDDLGNLEAWQKGITGYPIVDAGMRQLWQTGWMHNRVRMIVGSFLVKHLLIDWRHGMHWFWDTLVDADIGANTASWQWIAGCGADAAPYFRIFNPMTQGTKFDPDGDYVRQFVPEIADLPNKYLNTPWDAPEDVLKEAGVVLGDTYPEPIVDHKQARERALSAYAEIKG